MLLPEQHFPLVAGSESMDVLESTFISPLEILSHLTTINSLYLSASVNPIT